MFPLGCIHNWAKMGLPSLALISTFMLRCALESATSLFKTSQRSECNAL